MPGVNEEVISKRTPPEVLRAMQTIRNYLKRGGWVQCIVDVRGGASFRLTDIVEEHWQLLKDAEREESNG